MVTSLLAWLEALGQATGIATSAPRYAAVSAAHVLGIALLLGPVLLADLHLLGLLPGLDGATSRLLRRTAAVGVALSLGTGVLLLAARPAEYAANGAMQLKLAVVALALANALAYEAARTPGRGWGRTAAGASLVLWLAALALGRWVAFV